MRIYAINKLATPESGGLPRAALAHSPLLHHWLPQPSCEPEAAAAHCDGAAGSVGRLIEAPQPHCESEAAAFGAAHCDWAAGCVGRLVQSSQEAAAFGAAHCDWTAGCVGRLVQSSLEATIGESEESEAAQAAAFGAAHCDWTGAAGCVVAGTFGFGAVLLCQLLCRSKTAIQSEV